jgi:hypothetical protein
VIAEGDEAPTLLDEGRRAEMIRLHRGPRAGELRGRGRARRRGPGGAVHLLVPLRQAAEAILQLAQLRDRAVHPLEQRDDLTLHLLARGGVSRGVEPGLDVAELPLEPVQRRVAHVTRFPSR